MTLSLGPATGAERIEHTHRERSEPRRTTFVAVAATGLLICTNGPSVYAVLRWFASEASFRHWTFLYPFGAVAAGGAILLWQRAREIPVRQMPWPLIPVTAYVVWALLSATWSVSPDATRTLALVGIGVAAFGCWFGWALTFCEQVWSVVIATTVAVALSVIVVVLQPEQGRMPVPYVGAGGEWRGIFGNRNSLSPVAMLGLIGLIGLVAIAPTVRRIAWCVPVAVMHVVAMVGAESNTSFFALGLCILTGAVVPLLWLLRRAGVNGRAVAAAGIASTAAGALLLLRNLTTLAVKTGRDPTLSQRRVIWADVRELIQEHPIRGYGFWAFWDRPDLTAQTYAKAAGAYGSAHNSILEVMLGLGIVGLVFYLGICAASIGGTFAGTWRERSAASWWWIVLVVFLMAQNLTESFVLWHSYNWVLFIAAGFAPFGMSAARAKVPNPR